jgi:hypothetical protein
MNIYDRIINILLEARIEGYIERLDELRAYERKANQLSRGSIQRINRAVYSGELDHPEKGTPEVALNKTKGHDPKGKDREGPKGAAGRITHMLRAKKEAAARIAQRAAQKKKTSHMRIPEFEFKPDTEKGPGKQTGPLETRGRRQRKKTRGRRQRKK